MEKYAWSLLFGSSITLVAVPILYFTGQREDLLTAFIIALIGLPLSIGGLVLSRKQADD